MEIPQVFLFGMLVLWIPGVWTNSDIERVGNPIQASSSGVDVSGAVFLINDIILAEGVLFALRAYFRSDTPMRFQIWRSYPDEGANDFRLVSELRVIPSVVDNIEDIYMVSKLSECTKVEGGDRLGLFFEEAPGAAVYVFDAQEPTAFAKTVNASSPPQVSDVLHFDALTFPYDFSVAAYVHTAGVYDDADGDGMVTCPPNLLIPDVDRVNGPASVDTESGATGATGATGPQGISGLPGVIGPIGATGSMGVNGLPGPQGIPGPEGVRGPVGATGSPGVEGHVGATGRQGPKGDQGERGPAGPPGPKGDVVEFLNRNASSPNALAVTADETLLSSNFFPYILLAWLVLLTLAFIVLVVVLAVRHRHRQRRPRTPESSFSHLVSIPSMGTLESHLKPEDDHSHWLDTMRTCSETSYSNDTLNTRDPSSSTPDLGMRRSSGIAIVIDDSHCDTPTHSWTAVTNP